MRIAMACVLAIGCGSSAKQLGRGERALVAVQDAFGGARAAGTLAGIVFEGVEPGTTAERAAATAAERLRTAAPSCTSSVITTDGLVAHYQLRDCIVLPWGRIDATFDVTWQDTPDGLAAAVTSASEIWQVHAASTWISRLAARRATSARPGEAVFRVDTVTRVERKPAGEPGRSMIEGTFTFGSARALRGTVKVTSGDLAGSVTLDYREDPGTDCPLDGSVEAQLADATGELKVVERWKRNTGPEYRPSYTLDISDGTHRESFVQCRWGSLIGPH